MSEPGRHPALSFRHLSVRDLLRLFPRPAPGADSIAWLTIDEDVYDELARRVTPAPPPEDPRAAL